MKAKAITAIFTVTAILAFQIRAQNGMQSSGHWGVGTVTPDTKPKTPYRELPPQADDFRVVDEQLYNIQKSKLWERVSGQVESSEGTIIIMDIGGRYTQYAAVKNLNDDRAVHGKTVSFVAMKTGKYKWNGIPVELYDCGTKPKPAAVNPSTKTNTVIPTELRSKTTMTNSPAAKSSISVRSK
jgi:hypothetical protein